VDEHETAAGWNVGRYCPSSGATVARLWSVLFTNAPSFEPMLGVMELLHQQLDCPELANNNVEGKTMTIINPHINFNGNAEEAFNFYKSIFGGEFAIIVRFKDMANPENPVSKNEENKIMHIALPIGKSFLMANDVPEIMGRTNENENRSKILISAESKGEADRLFSGLSAGGQIEGPIGDSPWGSYFGCLRDKYGIEWMVVLDPEYRGKI
jgi:PhnB protein